MINFEDFLPDPNAGAYEKDETRRGPPLEYVGEKIKSAVVYAHAAYRVIEEDRLTAEAESKRRRESPAVSVRAGYVAFASFRYALTAFLALYNMLGMIQEEPKIRALLDMESADFREWLDRIEREGSVTG